MKKVIIKEDNAASLVAIIVMAIVAIIITVTVIKLVTKGVNVLSKAQSATTETQEAQRVEEINLLLTNYKTNIYTSNQQWDNFENFLIELKSKQTIDEFWHKKDLTIVKYNDAYVLIKTEENNNIVIGSIPLLGDEYAQKTMNNYEKSVDTNNKEIINFETDNVYLITDDVTQYAYEYIIPNFSEITLVIIDDIEINNKFKDQPAIELQENSSLNIYTYANVTVSSLYNGNDKIIYNEISDMPGYAGIYVPTSTKLNIFGKGKLTVYGGPAKKGGTYSQTNFAFGNGGGGAGAGIGGNGGTGGIAAESQSMDGGIGGSCGDINLYGSVQVYVYGGAGAEGGDSNSEGAGAGGGYPGAGIGGGGAGGGGATKLIGAGGYSGGAGISLDNENIKGGQNRFCRFSCRR